VACRASGARFAFARRRRLEQIEVLYVSAADLNTRSTSRPIRLLDAHHFRTTARPVSSRPKPKDPSPFGQTLECVGLVRGLNAPPRRRQRRLLHRVLRFRSCDCFRRCMARRSPRPSFPPPSANRPCQRKTEHRSLLLHFLGGDLVRRGSATTFSTPVNVSKTRSGPLLRSSPMTATTVRSVPLDYRCPHSISLTRLTPWSDCFWDEPGFMTTIIAGLHLMT